MVLGQKILPVLPEIPYGGNIGGYDMPQQELDINLLKKNPDLIRELLAGIGQGKNFGLPELAGNARQSTLQGLLPQQQENNVKLNQFLQPQQNISGLNETVNSLLQSQDANFNNLIKNTSMVNELINPQQEPTVSKFDRLKNWLGSEQGKYILGQVGQAGLKSTFDSGDTTSKTLLDMFTSGVGGYQDIKEGDRLRQAYNLLGIQVPEKLITSKQIQDYNTLKQATIKNQLEQSKLLADVQQQQALSGKTQAETLKINTDAEKTKLENAYIPEKIKNEALKALEEIKKLKSETELNQAKAILEPQNIQAQNALRQAQLNYYNAQTNYKTNIEPILNQQKLGLEQQKIKVNQINEANKAKPKILALTPAQTKDIQSSLSLIKTSDDILNEIAKNKDAVGIFQGNSPDWLINWQNPKGISVRSMISDLSSKIFLDRSGTAVTASESARLKPYLPKISDSPQTIINKLKIFKQRADEEYKLGLQVLKNSGRDVSGFEKQNNTTTQRTELQQRIDRLRGKQ